MGNVCRSCGWHIEYVDGSWVDVWDDTECYDADTNRIGEHAP